MGRKMEKSISTFFVYKGTHGALRAPGRPGNEAGTTSPGKHRGIAAAHTKKRQEKRRENTRGVEARARAILHGRCFLQRRKAQSNQSYEKAKGYTRPNGRPKKLAPKLNLLFFLHHSAGHPGPNHAARRPVPLHAWHGTAPRPLQAGQSLHPAASEQNRSAPTVSAPLPWQKPQAEVPAPEQQSQVSGRGR